MAGRVVTTVPVMAKYDRLKTLLAESDGRVELSFDEVDELVGGLPVSARNDREWWANTHSSPQARAWLACGRRVEMVSFARDRVRFGPPASEEASVRIQEAAAVPVPQLTGGELDLRVLARWEVAGAVTMDGRGKPVMPDVPAEAGVFRVVFIAGGRVEAVIVGETDNLRRTTNGFRSPRKQRANVRMNERLRQHLRAGGEVSVEVATDARFYAAGQRASVDLDDAAARVLVERAARMELTSADAPLTDP